MLINTKIFGLIFLVLFVVVLIAQPKPNPIPVPKTIKNPQKDSLKLYKKIKKQAQRHKITALAYQALFVDSEAKAHTKRPASPKNKNPYLKYTNRIIRSVMILVYDPFGYSVTDTVLKPINSSQKIGNNLHITSGKFVIQNRLLFKQHEKLDALKLSESERILRAVSFVNDAKIFVGETETKDSVDVYVIVHDKWPIDLGISASDIAGKISFRNQNLFGWGQQFEQSVGFYKPDNSFEYSGLYKISNLDNTFISPSLAFQSTRDGKILNLIFDRPYYSPLANWAGAAQVTQNWLPYRYLVGADSLKKEVPLNNIYFDLWGGKNFKLGKTQTLFNRSANLFFGGRYYQSIYQKRPSRTVDTSYKNYIAYVGNVGVSIQQFYKDKYIYRFGANEDVPEGLIFQLVYGTLKRETLKLRYYLGFDLARAKHFDFGYFSSSLAYGIFFNKKITNDVTISYKIKYFSELLQKRKWYFREFLSYTFLYGEHKLAGETITLSSDDLFGFNAGDVLFGTTKMLINSETVAYMPYNIIGFRMAPVLSVGMGILGDAQNKLYKSRLYQGYSLGLLLRNENLLNSTFQFAFGFYPFLPNGQLNAIKFNPIGSFTLKVRGFAAGRPEFIVF